jgi:hypothetical protein
MPLYYPSIYTWVSQVVSFLKINGQTFYLLHMGVFFITIQYAVFVQSTGFEAPCYSLEPCLMILVRSGFRSRGQMETSLSRLRPVYCRRYGIGQV